MKQIKEKFIFENIIQKSRFIGILYPLKSKLEINDILNTTKKEYPKATHYCYAYIFDGISKSNDDGEPSATAGKPILENLVYKQLNRVILIVIRYFGGIKLGKGGLTRTYLDIAKQTIESANLFDEVVMFNYEIKVNYENNDALKKYLIDNNISIINVNYYEIVMYIVSTNTSNLNDLLNYMQGKVEIKYLDSEIDLIQIKEN